MRRYFGLLLVAFCPSMALSGPAVGGGGFEKSVSLRFESLTKPEFDKRIIEAETSGQIMFRSQDYSISKLSDIVIEAEAESGKKKLILKLEN